MAKFHVKWPLSLSLQGGICVANWNRASGRISRRVAAYVKGENKLQRKRFTAAPAGALADSNRRAPSATAMATLLTITAKGDQR